MSTFIEISAYVIGVAGLCWGIYVYYKQKKYPAQLTCDVLESISLSAPEKLGGSKVRIMIGNQKVSGCLSYVKFLLVSVGDRDIVSDAGDKIVFDLPMKGRWISFDVVGESNGVESITNIEQGRATLHFPKLRVNESIVLEGVYDYQEKTPITVTHRIRDTRDVLITETLLKPSYEELIHNSFRAMATAMTVLMIVSLCNFILPISPNYYVKKDGSTRVYVEAQLKDVNTIYVKEPGHAFGAPTPEFLTYDEFASNYTRYEKLDTLIRNSYALFYTTIFVTTLMVIVYWIKPMTRIHRRKKNKSVYEKIMSAAR